MSNYAENVEGIRLETLFPLIEEKLKSGGEVSFKPHGISMLPLIRQGKDSATIGPLKAAPKKNDVIFYRRPDGQFVLHRIIGKNENGFILCGDNQYIKEYGVKSDWIIGIMTAVTRDGVTIPCGSSKYRKCCKYGCLHRNRLRMRQFMRRVVSKLKRVFKIK